MSVIEYIFSDEFAYIYIAAFIGFIIGEIYERGTKKMSILINGMEVPRNCWECGFCKTTTLEVDFCVLNRKQYNWELEERPSDCPLVPVPPHGRLIDADAINHEDEIWKKKCIPQQVVYNAWVVAGEMPTVIPADKDGEE